MNRLSTQTRSLQNAVGASLRRTNATKSTATTSPRDGQTHGKAESTGTNEASKVTEQPHKKTQAELDEEMRIKLANLSGDGGEAGIEYEDGKPVAMRRGSVFDINVGRLWAAALTHSPRVKQNMFRYI